MPNLLILRHKQRDQKMASVSAYHSALGGADFLGLRTTSRGMEIVYDDGVARRLVWRVASTTSQDLVGDALRVAVGQLRVIPALYTELKKRSIAVEAVFG